MYFAIFAFLYAANIAFDYQNFLSPDAENRLFYLRLHRAVMPYNPIFALLFVYSLFDSRIPKTFWVISLGLMVTGFFAVLEPDKNFVYIQIFLFATFVEFVRMSIVGYRKKMDGYHIIAIGFMFLFVFSSYDGLMDFGLIDAVYNIQNGYPFGFFGLIICSSIYLARDFAHTTDRLVESEREAKETEIRQRLLEMEDERKSKELEEARNLQLSMLPNCINKINGHDICFDMKPAAEVGGDFYDYHVSDDGALTLVIGDATGHGLKAGILVSIIKSLFISHDGQADILSFFQKSSRTIKQMNLGNLYMALMLLRIKDGKMTMSSAGMPAVFIYRQATKFVEEFVIKGMPLGAFDTFNYKLVETELLPGDTVLLMSDGLAELFNDKNEMLDYPRISEAFKEVAEKHPTEILEKLQLVGEKWRDGREQQDDITLLIFKAKADDE